MVDADVCGGSGCWQFKISILGCGCWIWYCIPLAINLNNIHLLDGILINQSRFTPRAVFRHRRAQIGTSIWPFRDCHMQSLLWIDRWVRWWWWGRARAGGC